MASASFEPALACVLRHEGGYSDHPADPGGATMMGITQATLAAARGRPVSKAEVRALAHSEAAAIYRVRYWNAIGGDELPAGLDLALFDFAVNSGPGRAVRMLQRLAGVTADGKIGPETLTATRALDSRQLIIGISAGRRAFLEGLPTYKVFGKGWKKRVADVEQAALGLARAAGAAKGFSSHPADQVKETGIMDFTKSIFSSRTLWANAIGMIALLLSWFGFDTSAIDKNVLAETALQVVAGASFIASTVFRVIATKRLA